MRTLLAGILLFASTLGFAQGLGTPGGGFGDRAQVEFLPVDEAYQLAMEVDTGGSLRLYWQIADSYYLYQHRFSFQLEGTDGAIALDATMPAALARTDEYFGEVEVYYDSVDVQLHPRQVPDSGTLSVTYQGCADAGLCYPPEKKSFRIDFTSGTISAAAPPPTQVNPQPLAQPDSANLLYMLLLAFVGGSILNLMPCVFPILSLKVLAFARSTDRDRHLHSWVYTAGIICSFVAVAALLIGLQAAGSAIGWGFQLQSPAFVISLAYLFVAMGLSLSGLIEFGGGVMNAGSSLADRRGLRGSFFTGVLAVVVASPCTAPFMGTALGFALTQPAFTALLVFAALGAGMAAPLLLFGYSGAARALMPKPGPWMETLKQLLAFPLYATAIWLLWVAGRQTGVNTMATALCGALVLALGLWLWRYGSWRRVLAGFCVLAALGLGAWRPVNEHGAMAGANAPGKVAWSEDSLDRLRRNNTPVFLDITADWCLTCIANEATVLLTDEMERTFDQHGVVYMVADWTNYDAGIARFLKKHGRTGIPLYLLYPADPTLPPLVLPQILTKSTVKEALDTISRKKPEIAASLSENTF
jgi:thiol:disulfide interchange protein DsbD